MASVQELEDALRNAHKAGDTRAARKLADALIMERQKAALPGGGVIPEQQQAIPGLDPNQPQGFTPDPSVAAIEAEADRQPTTLGGMMARDVPRTARGVAQGTTLGFSDEALAGVRSLTGENYGEALADERAELDKLGGARLPAEMLGSLPLGFAAGGRAAAAKTLGGRVGQGALMGGGFGGAYGFGSGEGGLMPRLENAAVSGGIGALGGAAIPLGIEGIGRGARFAGERVVPFLQRTFGGKGGAVAAQGTVRDQAARRVAQTILEQYPDMSPQQAIRNAQRVVQRYGPRAALMDAGDLTRELAKTTVRQGGAPGMKVEKFARDRQEGALAPSGRIRGGQYERVKDVLDEAGGGTKSGLAAQRSLKAQQSRASKPLYEQTANDPANLVPDEQFAQVVDDPYVAEQIAKVKGSKLHGVKIGGKKVLLSDLPDNSMPVIDQTQKRMSDAAGEAYRAGRTHEGDLIVDARRQLVAAADEAFPDYAKAREVWRDFKGVMDADDLGQKFMRGDVDVLEDAVQRMSPTEKGQFRAGVMKALKNIAGKTIDPTDTAHNLLKTPNLRERVRLAFDNPHAFRKYMKGLVGEREMARTYSALTRGSDTAKNLASMQKDAGAAGMGGEVAGAGIDLATGNKIGLGYRLGRMLRPRGILGPPEPVRQEMAGILTSQNIDDLLRAAEIASGGKLNRQALEQAFLAAQASGAQRGILQ